MDAVFDPASAAKPGDPRFFRRSGPHSVADIALALDAELANCEADGQAERGRRLISDVAPLHAAGPLNISFLDNRRYVTLLESTKAGAVIVHPEYLPRIPAGTAAIVTPEPYLGWAKVSALFYPAASPAAGRHPAAIIHPDAVIDASAEIGPGAVVGARAEIGAGSIIGPLAVIGEGVVIGKNCRIHAHATVSHTIMGDHVVIYPGARIGQDGFGFAVSKTGVFVPIQHLGRVIIGSGAEVGANTTIDRGSVQDTVIEAGVHIDNLVQIGHNAKIGKGTVIVAQAGVSGSTTIGEQVTIAAQAGVTGHLNIGKGARIGAKSGVMNDLEPGAEVLGAPAQPAKAFFREVVMLRKLSQSGRKPNKTTPTD
jgi:UDP-3-O-[3-hydroxymyristoyl] glucosamine N-acyltransferase